MNRILIAFIGVLFFSFSINAQELDTIQLHKYFDVLEDNDKFMGRVALAKKGQLIFERDLGFSDIELALRPEKFTGYRIGSISKTFTATLVLKAVDDGYIKLSDNIHQWFPSIVKSDKVTLENLLRHSSGIYSLTDDSNYLNWNTQSKSEKELINMMNLKDLAFEPGTKEVYSNSNYILLSYILEKVYKEPFDEILRKNIVQPLGLKNTYIRPNLEVDNSLAKSYIFKGRWEYEPMTHHTVPMGAGNIVSTPVDLTVFINTLFSGGLVSKESLGQMKTVYNDFGMGLIELPFNNKIAYGHTGGIDGFISILGHFPEEAVTCVILSNGSIYNINDIAVTLLKAIYKIPFDMPIFSNYSVTNNQLERYIGLYSSSELPLKITITREENTLLAQATGQPSFILEPVSKDVFQFTMAGVVIQFDLENNLLTLKQGGGSFVFKKE